MTNEEKLLPCPFCGGVAEILKISDNGRTIIGCNNTNKCNMLADNTVDNAIKLWNTRHNPHVEIAEELAEALRKIAQQAADENGEWKQEIANQSLQKYEKMKGE